jgi:hypothetical protein
MIHRFFESHPVLWRTVITVVVLSMLVISSGAPRGYGG